MPSPHAGIWFSDGGGYNLIFKIYPRSAFASGGLLLTLSFQNSLDWIDMLPSLAARDVEEGLESYVANEFLIASKTFTINEEKVLKSVLARFLDEPHVLTKGSWVEVKMPFRQASDRTDIPFTHLQTDVIAVALRFPFNPEEYKGMSQ